jgi:hypothetical protein
MCRAAFTSTGLSQCAVECNSAFRFPLSAYHFPPAVKPLTRTALFVKQFARVRELETAQLSVEGLLCKASFPSCCGFKSQGERNECSAPPRTACLSIANTVSISLLACQLAAMAWLLTASLSGVCLALTYYFINLQRFKNLARANGCQPPRKYAHKDPVFGLDVFIQEGKMFGEHTFFPTTIQRYEQNGTTFETKSLGKQNICSCKPDNLQSVFATNAKDWGVSYRLPALKDYFGCGFLTTDGVEWEHSRALLTPSFTRANLSDPTDFDHYLELMMKQIPRDGSTIDLQELLFSLVSLWCLWCPYLTPMIDFFNSTLTRLLFSYSATPSTRYRKTGRVKPRALSIAPHILWAAAVYVWDSVR